MALGPTQVAVGRAHSCVQVNKRPSQMNRGQDRRHSSSCIEDTRHMYHMGLLRWLYNTLKTMYDISLRLMG